MAEQILKGTGIGRSVAIAHLRIFEDNFITPTPEDAPSGNLEDEGSALTKAMQVVSQDLKDRAEKADGETQEILEATSELADDPEILDQAQKLVAEGKAATYAIFSSFQNIIDHLKPLGGYFAERVTDLEDVARRVVRVLRGEDMSSATELDPENPVIVVAKDLSPADTSVFTAETVAGMITEQGGSTSHTAIIAGAKGIPALVGVAGALELPDGAKAIIHAGRGEILVNPTESEIQEAEQEILEREKLLSDTSPGQLKDGTLIDLLANIGGPEDVPQALELGAQGVGLFRTEFLFLDTQTAPTVEDQANVYREVLAAFPGQKVVIRMLDAGSDKPLAFLPEQEEENPALGLRGYRMQEAYPEVLEAQLEALAQADRDTESELWVMAPMIADVRDAKRFVEKASSFGLKTVGVMAEVPSSALLAEDITEHAAFMSIGTNDLTQYTLAADRMLASVSEYQSAAHPAVLRMIKMISDGCQANNKPVSVCGEAAGIPELAVILVGLGVRSLSMSAHNLADVRAELAQVTLAEAEERAREALKATAE